MYSRSTGCVYVGHKETHYPQQGARGQVVDFYAQVANRLTTNY